MRSRKGRIRDSTRGGVHSLFRRGNDRYGVTDGTLYTGPDLAAAVAAGFSGPVDFAAFQDLTWVMNPAKQGIHGGGAAPFRAWLPAEPTGKMVATAGAERITAIAEFDSVEGWSLTRWLNGARRVEPDAEVPLDGVGVITVTNGSADVVGTNTAWTSALDGKNIRIDGSDNTYFTVIASVTDATHLTLMAPYDGSSAPGRTYLITETKPAKSYVAGISGTALAVNCDPAGQWQVETDFAARNLLIDGAARDEDVFRFWIRAENPGAVASVRVTLLAGAISENRQYVTATVPAAALNPTADGWTQVRISRGANPLGIVETNADYQDLVRRHQEALDAGRSIEADILLEQRRAMFDQLIAIAPPFFRSPNGVDAPFDWANVTGMWIEVEVTEATGVRFDKAELQGRVTGALSGHWTFFVSYDTDDSHETNGAAQSDTIRLDNQPVTLSAIPTSTDPQVTRRHVYGVGPGVEQPLRFSTIEDNVTTSITLNANVRDVQDLGKAMVIDADPPPAADGIMAQAYFNRLIAWKGPRVYWTPKDQPWKFPGSNDEDEGNWVDAGDETDPIQHVTNHARMMVIYKRASIWRVNGDIDQVGVDPERTAASMGARGKRCVVSGAGVDYFLGAEGVYLFDGQREVKISADLDPLFRGEWARVSGDVLLPPLDRDNADASVLAYRAGRIYLSYPAAGNTAPTATLVYDVATKQWARDSGAFTALYDEGPDYALMGATAGGLFALESGTDDAGAPIPIAWQSPAFNQGLANNPKVYSDLAIEFQSPGQITVKVVYDDGAPEALGSIHSNGRTTAVLPLAADGQGRRAKMIAVRIEGDVTAETVLYGVFLHWYPEEREALSFDSGVIDFGGSARVLDVEAEITSAAPVNWAVDTDAFGGAMAERERDTLPATARRPILVRLDNKADGRRGRVRMWSDGEFQLHALTVRVEVLPVGIGPAETWRPPARNS